MQFFVGARLIGEGVFEIAFAGKPGSYSDGVLEIAIASKLCSYRERRRD